MSLRRAQILVDESQPDLSLSSSTEDVPRPGMVGSQDPVGRSSPTVGILPGDDNSYVLLSYRGRKVTSFEVKGRRLLCLPQAFDLFLRDLVGGLHTVYTKLRRLGVKPVVCSVDQVRILRRLGAIQPGVNRCKMILPTEFDILYDDCTNSRIRPGRPLKRSVPLRTSYVPGSDHLIENLMKTASLPERYPHGVGQNHIKTIVEDQKRAMTSFPVGLLAWSDLWRRSPAALYPVTGVLDSRSALDRHHLYWRVREDIPVSSCFGMKADSHLTWNSTRQSSSYLSADPPELRCRENPGIVRQIHDDVANEPLNLKAVRGRARSPEFTSVMQSTKENSRKTDEISATVEGTSNSRESNDTVEHALSTERLTTPPGEWSDTCDFTVKSPSIDCNDGSCSVDSPSVDCAENLCSVESLLKDVHELVMMAAKNSHQRERLISCEKEHLEMQAAKEMKIRHQVERQLVTEKKNRVALQRKLRMERRLLRRLQTKFSAQIPRDERQQINSVRQSSSSRKESATSFQHDA